MRNVILKLTFITLVIINYSCSSNGDKKLEKLIVGEWQEDDGKGGFFSTSYEIFNADKTFVTHFFGGNAVSGTYEIKDGVLYLYKDKYGVKKEYGKCKIKFNSDDELIEDMGSEVYRLIRKK